MYFLTAIRGTWSPEGVIVLRFSGAGVSDVGRVRPHNEDSGFVGPYVALVADGVGGAAAGEIASATAAYSASAVALGRSAQRPERSSPRPTPPRRTASAWGSSATSTGWAWPPP